MSNTSCIEIKEEQNLCASYIYPEHDVLKTFKKKLKNNNKTLSDEKTTHASTAMLRVEKHTMQPNPQGIYRRDDKRL